MATKQAIDKSIKQLINKAKKIELSVEERILFVKGKENIRKFMKIH